MRFWFKKNSRKDDKGTVIIEFSLLLPVLLIMLIGLADVATLVCCSNKMNRIAHDISNVVTRGELTKPQLDALLKSSIFMAQPFKFTTSGNVIVTSVSKPDAA